MIVWMLDLSSSSVHMEESSVMQGAQGMLVQNWPTVSSAAGEWQHCSNQKAMHRIWHEVISAASLGEKKRTITKRHIQHISTTWI